MKQKAVYAVRGDRDDLVNDQSNVEEEEEEEAEEDNKTMGYVRGRGVEALD